MRLNNKILLIVLLMLFGLCSCQSVDENAEIFNSEKDAPNDSTVVEILPEDNENSNDVNADEAGNSAEENVEEITVNEVDNSSNYNLDSVVVESLFSAGFGNDELDEAFLFNDEIFFIMQESLYSYNFSFNEVSELGQIRESNRTYTANEKVFHAYEQLWFYSFSRIWEEGYDGLYSGLAFYDSKRITHVEDLRLEESSLDPIQEIYVLGDNFIVDCLSNDYLYNYDSNTLVDIKLGEYIQSNHVQDDSFLLRPSIGGIEMIDLNGESSIISSESGLNDNTIRNIFQLGNVALIEYRDINEVSIFDMSNFTVIKTLDIPLEFTSFISSEDGKLYVRDSNVLYELNDYNTGVESLVDISELIDVGNNFRINDILEIDNLIIIAANKLLLAYDVNNDEIKVLKDKYVTEDGESYIQEYTDIQAQGNKVIIKGTYEVLELLLLDS